MRVSQVIRSIKTSPKSWVLKQDNDILISFTFQGYTFGKFNKEYGGTIKLVNKPLNVSMEWEATDPVGSQLWSSMILHYIDSEIIGK